MISTPFRFLKSKKLSSQKETFIKEIQVFAENLIKKKKKFEENTSKEHSKFNLASKENKELIQTKVLNFISKLSIEERMKLFTISNKWLVEVLIQLFSLYEDNNRITFGLNDEMTPFIGDGNKCWKCGHEFNVDEFYSKNLSDSRNIPFCDECGYQYLNYKSWEDFFGVNKSNETDAFSYKLYFKICDSLDENDNINRIQMESEILKYIKIYKPYNIITFDKELLLDFEKLKKFFEYFTQINCFKDWITLSENKQSKNFNLPKWVYKKYSFTFFQILVIFFEQHILLNYEYFFYTNRIYQTKYQEKMEELYDEINNKVNQINNEVFSIDKIFSENIIKDHINGLNHNNNNNYELSTQIYSELKDNIKDYNGQKDKMIKLLERLTFLDLDEVTNKRQSIYESYKNYIFETLENEIANELRDDFIQKKKEKKHKKAKKSKNKNIIEAADDKNEIKEDNKEENKEENKSIEEENQNFINEEKENKETKAENENKIFIKEKKEKIKEFFLFATCNKSKKSKRVGNKKKKTNLIKKNSTNSDDTLIRIKSNNSLSTYKSSNNQDEKEDFSSITSDANKNIIQDNDNSSEFPPNKSIQNPTNNNDNQYFYTDNTDYNDKSPQISNNFNSNTYNNFNDWFNKFYDDGIDAYCSITQYNVSILDNLKDKYFKIIIDEIIKKNFKDKYDLKFKFYGSSCTGLSIEGSDSDCCIFFKELIQNKQNKLSFKEELYFLLVENQYKREDISYELKQIFGTKIPRIVVKIDVRNELKKNPLNNIYKYLRYDDMSYIKIDFTFTKEEKYLMKLDNNIQYVKKRLEEFPQLRPVQLVLKRYFKNMKMNEVFKGGISSYSLFLLELNPIYNYQKENPSFKIRNSQLLVQIFEKFSYFKFYQYGIGIDNNEFILGFLNRSEILYIFDPLTGNNIASNGECKGLKLRETFFNGFEQLCNQSNFYLQLFQNKNFLLLNNCNPIKPIVSLLNKIKDTAYLIEPS